MMAVAVRGGMGFLLGVRVSMFVDCPYVLGMSVPVLGMFMVLFMMSAEHRPGDLIANEEQEYFQQIPQLAPHHPAVFNPCRELRKHDEQDKANENLDNHVLGDRQPGFSLIKIAQRSEWLWDQDLA